MSVKIAENIVLDKFTAVDFLVNGSDGRILLRYFLEFIRNIS